MSLMVYDCEIKNAIPERGRPPIDGIQYCAGWQDFAGMGVAVICAYVWPEGYRIFMADNFDAFRALAADDNTLCVGYNNHVFDDHLVAATLGFKIPEHRSYDLLGAIRVARGQHPRAVSGPSLHQLCQANFLPGKSGNGAFAPILWQKGKIGQVVDYALNDCRQTVLLLELAMAGRLRDPDSGRILNVTPPHLLPQETVGVIS